MSVQADRSRLRAEDHAPARVRSCSASSSETAADRLTDDLLLEILPRVPAKSLCRFRCVSKHWRGLIDHPDHRKKLPQTLAGFLYSTTFATSSEAFLRPPLLLTCVSGSPSALVATSLAFLPNHWLVNVLDCCNGLILCRWYPDSTNIGFADFRYVVCNLATEKWVALPDSGQATCRLSVTTALLGFDPAQSSHFYVLELLADRHSWGPIPAITGVAVYSSETGGWVHKKERWNQHITLPYPHRRSQGTAFLNNHLYVQAFRLLFSKRLAAVDTDAETWTNSGIPRGGLIDGFIQCSQGRMHHANFYRAQDKVGVQLAVYVLENHEGKKWIPKHVVEASVVFGGIDVALDGDFDWVGIHLDCNLIFFTAGRDTTFMCYNMDRQQVKVIRNIQNGKKPYLPYVPLYAELPSLHM